MNRVQLDQFYTAIVVLVVIAILILSWMLIGSIRSVFNEGFLQYKIVGS